MYRLLLLLLPLAAFGSVLSFQGELQCFGPDGYYADVPISSVYSSQACSTPDFVSAGITAAADPLSGSFDMFADVGGGSYTYATGHFVLSDQYSGPGLLQLEIGYPDNAFGMCAISIDGASDNCDVGGYALSGGTHAVDLRLDFEAYGDMGYQEGTFTYSLSAIGFGADSAVLPLLAVPEPSALFAIALTFAAFGWKRARPYSQAARLRSTARALRPGSC